MAGGALPAQEPRPADAEAALDLVRQWLHAAGPPVPAVLYVRGRAGMGKSWLLRSALPMAEEAGLQAIWGAEAEGAPPGPATRAGRTPGGGRAPRAGVAATRRRVRFLDLPPAPEQARAALTAGAAFLGRGERLLVAGRLATDEVWEALQHAAHASPEVVELVAPPRARWEDRLLALGVSDDERREGVLRAAAGSPGALWLAADILRRSGAAALRGQPEWRLGIHRLAARILEEAAAPELRAALEACSVVRRFDEGLLNALVGEAVEGCFTRLSGLSAVAPVDGGLALHPDARRLLAADLRWRHPERWNGLRQRAQAHYRRRFAQCQGEEREALVGDLLYLCDAPALHAALFPDSEPAAVWVEPGRRDQGAELAALWTRWVGGLFGLPEVAAVEAEELARILAYPGTRLRLCRDRRDHLRGFSAIVPVCRQSVDLLRGLRVTAPILDAAWRRADLAALPASAEASRAWFVHHIAETPERAEEARAALVVDALGLLAREGTYFASAALPAYHGLLQGLGFSRAASAHNPQMDPAHPVEGYVLDLSRCGFWAWFGQLLAGTLRPSRTDLQDVECAVQDVLARWHDEAWLHPAPLMRLLDLPPSGARGAALLRERVELALQAARRRGGPQAAEAFAALDAAYFHRATSHEKAARELGVSRSTFYRLLRRAIGGVAQTLVAEPLASWGPGPGAGADEGEASARGVAPS